MRAYFDLVSTPIEIGDIVYSEHNRTAMIIVSGVIGVFNTRIKCFDGSAYRTITSNDKNVFPVYVLPQYRNYNNDKLTKLILSDDSKKFTVSIPENRFDIIEPLIKGLDRIRKKGFVKEYAYYHTTKTTYKKCLGGKSYYYDNIRLTVVKESVKAAVRICAMSSKEPYIATLRLENSSVRILNDKTVETINPIITGQDDALKSPELVDKLFELSAICEKS